MVPPLRRARTWKLGVLAVAAGPFFLELEQAELVEVEEAEAHADAEGPEVVEAVAYRETSELAGKSTNHPLHLIHPPDDVVQEASMAAWVVADDSAEEEAGFVGAVALLEELEVLRLAEGVGQCTCTGHIHHRHRP